jgi:ABC-type transport system involved in cytochrome c biogenesis permease subunit
MPNPVEPYTHLTILQFAAAAAAATSYLVAFWLQFQAMGRQHTAGTTPGVKTEGLFSPKLAVGNGVFLTALLLLSRMVDAHRMTLPLSDYFDAFLLLGLVLSMLWAYLQWTRHLRALAAFLLPMIFAIMAVGIVLGVLGVRHFGAHNPWVAAHIASVLLGTASFAAGCVGGITYLLADQRLKKRGRAGWDFFALPSLASIEKFTRHAIVLGFALLTLAALTGIFRAVRDPQLMGHHWYFSPKVILTAVVWLVYGSLLNMRLVPILRGARCAWLSIIGFVLLMTVFVVML